MILEIFEAEGRINPIKLSKGVNVIVADKEKESEIKDTMNGLGKTTLIKIIHFVLGADIKGLKLPLNLIKGYKFGLKLLINGEEFNVTRSVDDDQMVEVERRVSKFSIQPTLTKQLALSTRSNLSEAKLCYSLEEWRQVLGESLFGLKAKTAETHYPSFRSLFPYFARSRSESYIDPFIYLKKSPALREQVDTAFLLGLNFEYPIEAKLLNDQHSELSNERGVVLAKLRTEKVNLQDVVQEEEKQIKNYKVDENYAQWQEQSDKYTETIHSMKNESYILLQKVNRYKQSLEVETGSKPNDIIDLYQQAGVTLGETVTKTLEQAKIFHENILRNRQNFLQVELSSSKKKIEDIAKDIAECSSERAKLMKLLDTHTALEEFYRFQERLLSKKNELNRIEDILLKNMENDELKKHLKASRLEIEEKLLRDFEQARPVWEQLITTFNKHSLELYKESGSLILEYARQGNLNGRIYSFDAEMPRSESHGVGKMKIFCYDLMLVRKLNQEAKIDFLIHDSNIFDGVDQRQVARAVELADKKAREEGFQYICFLNSDQIPYDEFSDSFSIEEKIKHRFGDKNPEDCLLKFRF